MVFGYFLFSHTNENEINENAFNISACHSQWGKLNYHT